MVSNVPHLFENKLAITEQIGSWTKKANKLSFITMKRFIYFTNNTKLNKVLLD